MDANKQITFKGLIIALVIAMLPSLYTIYSGQNSEFQIKLEDYALKLQNHSLRIQILEKKYINVNEKLDHIIREINNLKIELHKSNR